jgi:hypothetical protein
MRKFFGIFIFFIFTQELLYSWGSGKFSDKQYLPDNNIQGILNQIEVVYISINGLVKHIPFYRIPKDHDADPRGNVVYLDLVADEDVPSIAKIELAIPNENNTEKKQENTEEEFEIVSQYDGIGYVRVLVTFTTGLTMQFLLDSASKIRCYEKNLNQEAILHNRTLTGEWQLNIKELRTLNINKIELFDAKKKHSK